MQDHLTSLRAPAWAQDLLLALFVAVMQVQGTVTRTQQDPAAVMRPLTDLGYLGYLLLIAGGVALIVRRRRPVAVFVTTAVASAAYYALDFPDGPGWLGLFVAVYTLTALGDGRRSLVTAGVGIAGLAICWLVAAADIEPRAALGWVFFRIGVSVMSAALGESVRSRRVIAAEAVKRAELAELTREHQTRVRVSEERLRIAREVHDTVAHAIAVINIQAGVTAHVLDRRPDRAREALEAIEQTSSRALEEMRAVLGVLRGSGSGTDTDTDTVPYPGLAQIGELAAEAREAGLEVELQVAPAPPAVPGAVGSAVYRILQESMTNVIRHVGPTRVTVDLGYRAGAVEIRVADDGPRDGPEAGEAVRHRPGSGIQGMRERCHLLGGELDAGPRTGGGFAVTARMPLVPSGPGHG
jgi:signal transduction histidine kinase